MDRTVHRLAGQSLSCCSDGASYSIRLPNLWTEGGPEIDNPNWTVTERGHKGVVAVADSGAEPTGEVRSTRAGVRHREHGPARLHRANLRLSAEEYADLALAARDAGMTPGGYAAQAALAAARGTSGPTPDGRLEQLRQLGRDLIASYTALNRIGTNLNQIAARVNATGELGADLPVVLRRVERRAAEVDVAVKLVRRELRSR
jgi:hypothetical protein